MIQEIFLQNREITTLFLIRFALSLDPSDEPSISGMNDMGAVGAATQTSRVWDNINRSLTGNSSNSTNTAASANGIVSSTQSAVATMTTPEVVITSVSIQSHPPNAPIRPPRTNVVDRSTAISTPNIISSTTDAASNFMETDVVAADITME